VNLRCIFMGTPDFAVPSLARMLEDGHEIACVYTQPPRPAGRGMAERKSPVHQFAETHAIEVRTPKSLRGEAEQAEFAALGADVAVVVAYGLILPGPVLAAPRLGCFNLHASLLPRWRGAAPIQRAIMAGDAETGVAVMRMAAGLDTGPVCLTERMAITAGMTAGELHAELSGRGARLMVAAMARLQAGTLDCRSQSETGVTYAAKIDKAEAHIDFARPAAAVLNHIHALSPWPGAWTMLPLEGRPLRLKILKAEAAEGHGRPGEVLDRRFTIACAEGAIRPVSVQREGKGQMDLDDFLNGTKLEPGTLLA
jgi:methionyl-tRNA formyltransferase